jgi:hypothetical protein
MSDIVFAMKLCSLYQVGQIIVWIVTKLLTSICTNKEGQLVFWTYYWICVYQRMHKGGVVRISKGALQIACLMAAHVRWHYRAGRTHHRGATAELTDCAWADCVQPSAVSYLQLRQGGKAAEGVVIYMQFAVLKCFYNCPYDPLNSNKPDM